MPKKIIGQRIIVKDYWSCDNPLCCVRHKTYQTAKRCQLAKKPDLTKPRPSISIQRIKEAEAFRLKMMGFTYKGVAKEMGLKGYDYGYNNYHVSPEQQARKLVSDAVYLIKNCYYHPLYKCAKKFIQNEKYNNPSAADLPFVATNTVYWHLKGKEECPYG